MYIQVRSCGATMRAGTTAVWRIRRTALPADTSLQVSGNRPTSLHAEGVSQPRRLQPQQAITHQTGACWPYCGGVQAPCRHHREYIDSLVVYTRTSLTVLYQPSCEEKKHAQTPPGTPNKTAHHTEYSTLMPHLLRDVVLFPAPSSSSHDPPHQLHQVLRRVGVLVKQERSSG